MFRVLKILFLFSFLALISSPALAANDELSLIFGLYQSDKASEMYKKFNPVIMALQEKLIAELEQPVEIKIQIYKTYQEALDALVFGNVDFVRFGPVSYTLAKSRNPGVQLLAMENKKGSRSFNGVIVVRSDSWINSLHDLKRQSFAFGDSNSTIGRYLAQAELLAVGIHGDDLEYKYLGRHDTVAKAVIIGDYQAGALKESSFNKANVEGELRVLSKFANVTKPWIARANLPEPIVDALTKVLLQLHDQQTLKKLKVEGFFPLTTVIMKRSGRV